MIFGGEFVSGIDLVDVCLWLFTLFFFGLIFYLRKEDRREGYPLEADTSGKQEPSGNFWMPSKKTFRLPHGRGNWEMSHGPRDSRSLALKRTAVWPGAPYEPTGNPMEDGVGPASYAERADVPDLTIDGAPRIAPYRNSPGYDVAKSDRDPRGLNVIGTDGETAGTVVDLWVDRSEAIIRYLEVESSAEIGTRRVLVPVPFTKIVGGRKPRVEVEAVTAAQFVKAPGTRMPDSVTRREEDRISGYFGGGKLYATPDRLEPML